MSDTVGQGFATTDAETLGVFFMRLFSAFVFLILFTAGAAAQSCGDLKAQLAAAQAGRPNQAVIASLTQRANSYNCNNGVQWGQNAACSGINAQLRQARSGGVNRSRIRRLEKQISRHCGGGGATREARNGTRQETKGNRNIFSMLFGRRDEREFVPEDPATRPTKNVERVDLNPQRYASTGNSNSSGGSLATRSAGRVKGSSRVGSSRTMCVRLCDGFYFPINNSSHSDNYYDELAMCVGRCPGADVSLYVHGSGEPVERMRSAMTGESYVNLPTAFNYRKQLSPGCGCTNGTQIVRGGEKSPPLSLASFAGTADGSAQTGAKDDARWSPYRAIYDETGKPLPPSLTAHGSEAATAAIAARAEVVDAPSLDPIDGSINPASLAAVEFDPSDTEVREVGPQFFSRAVAEFAATKDRPRGPRVQGPPITVITVTPLRDQRAATPPAPEPDESVSIEAGSATIPAAAAKSELPPGTAAMVGTTDSDG